jgi:hypothetical protein
MMSLATGKSYSSVRRSIWFSRCDPSHHHQQIYIAVRAGIGARVRTEENDFLRMKTLDDPPHHFSDGFFDFRPLNCRLHFGTASSIASSNRFFSLSFG